MVLKLEHNLFYRYFTATEGVDQIQWLMGPVEKSTADSTMLQVMIRFYRFGI
jgi:hypothetical protein